MKTMLGIVLALAALPMYGQRILAPILFGQASAPSTVATPTFSYDGTSQLTISDSTSLAVICYTTDGSTPTETANLCTGGTTQTYSTALTITPTETVKALGTLAGYTDSAVASTTIYYGCPSGSGSCVDHFGGANGAGLNTYNSNWTSMGTNCYVYSGGVGMALTGSGAVGTNREACFGAYYAGSTSTTSTVTWVAQAGTVSTNYKSPCVDSDGAGTISSPRGYCLQFTGTISGGNFPEVQVQKQGAYLTEWAGTFSATANHTLSISVNNSTHVISISVDGTFNKTYTDSSSPLTTGYPGIYISNNTTTYTDSYLEGWCDTTGVCP